jgi:hypothetical protein
VGHQEETGQLVLLARMVLQELVELLEQLVLLGLKESKEILDQLVLLDLLGQTARLVLQELVVRLVRPVRLV